MSHSGETRSSRDRLSDKTFNWVLLEVVGPILIMLMVGALVFFLIEVFYRGPHALRLGWVLGLFTAASVLVSRISIAEGLERAAIFGFALAAATLYVTVSLVDFEYGALFFLEPIVVGLLIGVVMWSANRLTWDCTMIDSSRDVSSIGLSEIVRRRIFKRKKVVKTTPNSKSESQDEDQSSPERRGFQRLLFLFFANAKNQNTPGLWVFYFAIAAFPIFGFGQWFAQVSEDWGYRWIFLLFAIYLASALGLLMLTSLLGLERYLRKRGAAMPGSISRAWVVVGTLFALGVMLVVLILPSPSLSNGLQDTLGFLTTKSKDTSKHAFGNDGQDEGEEPKGEKKDQNAKGGKEKSGEKGAGNGKTGKGGDGKSDKKGNDSSGDKKSDQKSDSKKSNSSEKKDGKKSESKDGEKRPQDENEKKDQNGEPKRGDEQRPENKAQPDEPKQAQKDKPEQNKRNGGKQNQPKKDNNATKKPAKKGGKQNDPQPPQQSQSSSQSAIAKFIGTVIKYVVYIGGILAVLILAWIFRSELAKLWNELFGGKQKEANSTGDQTLHDKRTTIRSTMNFAQFSDPFNNGFAEKWPPATTLQYSFEALEAWGRGHDLDRENDQTPHEFSKDVRTIDPDVSTHAHHLADLLGQSMFSGEDVERSSVAALKQLWRSMLANPPRVHAAPELQPS